MSALQLIGLFCTFACGVVFGALIRDLVNFAANAPNSDHDSQGRR